MSRAADQRLSPAGQGILRGRTAVHRLGRQDHELPERGVAAYVADEGHAFIDRRRCLPKDGTDDPARLAAAHVPAAVRCATKPRLAVGRIARALEAGVPVAWVATDSIDGVGEVESVLRRAGKGDVLGVTGAHQGRSWGQQPGWSGTAATSATGRPRSAYVRLAAGDGTKGPRLHDRAYLALADLEAEEVGYAGSPAVWPRGLLIRRSLADQSLAFFPTWGRQGTPLAVLVRVEGRRWAIEDAFETAKTERGLAHHETRRWQGGHRHVALVMLAFALLAVIRRRANTIPPPPKSAPRGPRCRWSAGRSRRSAVSPAG